MQQNAKALVPDGRGVGCCLGITSATCCRVMLLQSSLSHPLSVSTLWPQATVPLQCTARDCSVRFPGKSGSFKTPPAGIQSGHQEVSPVPGKLTPVTVPRSTRRLIRFQGSLPRSWCVQEGGTSVLLASGLTPWGGLSGRYEINIKRHICVFPESNTHIHTKSTPWCPPNLGPGLFLALSTGQHQVTWPGPAAGGAACRWGAHRTRREARAAAESSWGRMCG